MSDNLSAAQQFKHLSRAEQEERIEEALKFKKQHPDVASYRFLQRHFGPNKDTIRNREKKLHGSLTERKPAHTRLQEHEEKALCYWLDFLAKCNIPLRYNKLENYGNHIIQKRDPDSGLDMRPLSEHWAKRWIKSHPQYKIAKQQSMEQARKEAMNAYCIRKWFEELKKIMVEKEIDAENFWNVDEMGVRVGVGRGKWVIIPVDCDQKGRFSNIIGSGGDRELVTMLESISAGGESIEPFAIVKGVVVLKKWFMDIRAKDFGIAVSDTAYSNDRIFISWLQHWERLSREKAICKETGIQKWRLLLLDGSDTHLTITSLQYCQERKVAVFLIPPHTSHFLQPLDVSVFQQWKHFHSEELDKSVRQGVGDLNKEQFFSYVEKIRERTFTKQIIKSGFRQCGYFPFRPILILDQLPVNNMVMEQVEEQEDWRVRRDKEREKESEKTPPSSPPLEMEWEWSSPIDHKKFCKQADLIQHQLRSSAEPQDKEEASHFRANIRKFLTTAKAKDAVAYFQTDYLWDAMDAQVKSKERKKRKGTRLQTGGVVYAEDVDRDLKMFEDGSIKKKLLDPEGKKPLEEQLPWEKQLWWVQIRTMVNDRVLLQKLTQKLRARAEKSALVCTVGPNGQPLKQKRKRKQQDVETTDQETDQEIDQEVKQEVIEVIDLEVEQQTQQGKGRGKGKVKVEKVVKGKGKGKGRGKYERKKRKIDCKSSFSREWLQKQRQHDLQEVLALIIGDAISKWYSENTVHPFAPADPNFFAEHNMDEDVEMEDSSEGTGDILDEIPIDPEILG
jgi:hypothetical protein